MTAAEPESRPVRPPPGRPGRRKGPAPVPRPSARRTAPRRGPNPTARNRPLPPPPRVLPDGSATPSKPAPPKPAEAVPAVGKAAPASSPFPSAGPAASRRFHQPSRSLEGVPPRCLPPRSRSRPRRSSLHPRRSPQRVPPSRSIGQRPCKETDPDRPSGKRNRRRSGPAALPALPAAAVRRRPHRRGTAVWTGRRRVDDESGGRSSEAPWPDTADSFTETPHMAHLTSCPSCSNVGRLTDRLAKFPAELKSL